MLVYGRNMLVYGKNMLIYGRNIFVYGRNIFVYGEDERGGLVIKNEIPKSLIISTMFLLMILILIVAKYFQ
jgi:hypothetical protein